MKMSLAPLAVSIKRAWSGWRQAESFEWRPAVGSLIGAMILWPLVHRLPMIGWDWYYWFFSNRIDFYPPWTEILLAPFVWLPWRTGLSFMNSLLLVSLAIFVYRIADTEAVPPRLLASALALLTPQVFMNLYLGSIEGLMLVGMMFFPAGVILALIKPNLTGWLLLARRQWLLWGAGVGLLSLVIWGWWPAETLSWMEPLTDKSLAIGWYNLGWPIALLGALLLPFSGAHPFRLMAAGFLLTPYLMSNHAYLLLPALGCVRGWMRVALWVTAWVSGLAAGALGSAPASLAIIFPLAVWLLLAGKPSWFSAAREERRQ